MIRRKPDDLAPATLKVGCGGKYGGAGNNPHAKVVMAHRGYHDAEYGDSYFASTASSASYATTPEA